MAQRSLRDRKESMCSCRQRIGKCSSKGFFCFQRWRGCGCARRCRREEGEVGCGLVRRMRWKDLERLELELEHVWREIDIVAEVEVDVDGNCRKE